MAGATIPQAYCFYGSWGGREFEAPAEEPSKILDYLSNSEGFKKIASTPWNFHFFCRGSVSLEQSCIPVSSLSRNPLKYEH
jgi:hypothetical protein